MGGLFSLFRQMTAVTVFNLRNLYQRLGSSLATVVGVAGVVMVFVGILSMSAGFSATLDRSGSDSVAMVLRSGTDTEMNSGLGLDDTRVVADAPGVMRDGQGPVVAAELFVIVDLPKRATDTTANVPLRGVGPRSAEIREGFRLLDGRMFEPGKNEIIVGDAALAEFAGLEVGDEQRWGENTWKVVGTFTTGGTAEDSELWTDARVLQPAYRRGSSFQSVRAKVASEADYQELSEYLSKDPRISVKVLKESDYYAEQGTVTRGLIQGLGAAIGLLMGFGAVFGALNTMYSAVSARTREIATLRALGFSRTPVLASVMVEALALTAIGGLLGGVLAYFLFNGYRAATLNFQSFSQVAFAFAVTPALLISGFLYAMVMGFVGGVFPAIRAARLPVATALREL